MKRLTCEEKQEIRQILIEDNKRIYDAQTLGNQNQAVNAKRAKHLRPEALAKIYNVTVHKIAYFLKKEGL